MKSCITFIILIWSTLGDPTEISKNGYLNPGRITWWQEKWTHNSIELSQTNAGTSDVSVIIHFRASTSINSANNLGIVQLNVPSNFSPTTSFYSDTLIIKKGIDMTASFKLNSVLPSFAGVYGPFQLITRSSTTGKIYDANYIFGCVKVSALVTISISSLITEAATLTSTTGIVGSKDALTFLFEVPAGINLWKHDIFEIIPDSHWGVSTSPTCSSIDIFANKYIKGPNNDNNLPCAIAATGGANGWFNTAISTASPATNSVYIYGLSQDVINNSGYQIKLQVSSFTFPSSTIPSSNFVWTVKIWRWGTTNILAGFTGAGPLTPAAGAISISSWAPYNTNLAQTDIPSINSFSIFTKLTFKLSHSVPNGGWIDINFIFVDILTPKWWEEPYYGFSTSGQCFVNNYIYGVSCAVTSESSVSIYVTGNNLDAYKDISITVLPMLFSGAKVAAIYSWDGSYIIDEFTSGLSWEFSMASPYAELTDFKFHLVNTNEYPVPAGSISGLQVGGVLSNNQYLAWIVQPSTPWALEYIMKVYLPFSNSGVSLLQAYIDLSAQYYDGAADNSNPHLSTSATSWALATPGTPGTISINFLGPDLPGDNYRYFAFGYGNNAKTALPFVRSNVGTFYECFTKVFATSSASTPIEFSNYVFSVFFAQTDSSLTAAPLCTDTFTGIPIIVNYHALNLDFNFGDSTNHYSLDVEFTSGVYHNLGTGIADGNALPLTTTNSALNLTATITSTTVTITGTGTVTATNTATIFLPIGEFQAYLSGVAASLTFYYVLINRDPTIKYVLYTGSSSSTFNTDTAKGINYFAIYTPSSGAYTVGETYALIRGSGVLVNSFLINEGDYMGVGLPAGFTASSGSVTLGGISSTAYSASSSSSSFVGGFMIGTASTSGGIDSGADFPFDIGGIKAALSTGQASISKTVDLLIFAASTTDQACSVVGGFTFPLNTAAITADSCSSDKLFTQGADSVDSTLSFLFTTVNPVPGNGQIIITLASGAWAVSSSGVATTCEGVGFTDYSAKDSIYKSCSVSGTTVTLTGFSQVAAGVVNVNIYHVVPITTNPFATLVQCFTEVVTYDENGYCIDSASSLTNSVNLAVSSDVGATIADFKEVSYPHIPRANFDI